MTTIHTPETTSFAALTAEATRHLQALLRCDTTNPPGDEYLAAAYLREQLTAEGIAANLIEPAPGRVSVWAKVAGTGAQRPLLLLSHTDVVPVERERWSVDPFGGELRDGFIYGRGAVDMKQMTAIQLTLLCQWARQIRAGGAPPSRDLIFLAVADEEQSGTYGARWIIDHMPELVDAEFALNEGGGFGMRFGKKMVYLCEGAQKGSVRITLTGTGKPGHAAIPHQESAVFRLSNALAALGRAPLPMHIIPTTRRFFATIASALPPLPALVLRQALNPRRSEWALRQVPDREVANALRAMIHNTASPTILKAGQALNVIPSAATALIDMRIVPGQTPDLIEREVRARIPDPHVQITIEPSSPGYEMPFETPLFAAIEGAIARHDPGALVAPYLFPAVSDSRFLAPRGVIAYGFIPHRSEAGVPAVQSLAHGHDERISLANIGFGVRVLHDTIVALCT